MRRLVGVLVVVLALGVGQLALPVAAGAAPQPNDWCGPGESAVDLPDCDGPVIALVHIAEIPDEITFAVAFEESDTGSSWSAIGGSSVPNVAADSVVLHTFARTKRYLRCAVTLTGDDPSVTFGVLIGQACKLF